MAEHPLNRHLFIADNLNLLRAGQGVYRDYHAEIADAGEILVNTTSELLNLAEAHHKAMQMYGQAYGVVTGN